MKFDEMVSDATSITIKCKIVITILSIALVVSLGYIICDKFIFNRSLESQGDVNLNVDSRVVEVLYHKVHDVRSKNPFWMYQNENNDLVSYMTEGAKMSLVYLNLKETDFSTVDCSIAPSSVNGYANYQCSQTTTNQIARENVERVFKELFGFTASINTSAVMRINSTGSLMYVYVTSLDAYVLYSNQIEEPDTSVTYQYELSKAVKTVTNDIQLYETILAEDTSSNVKTEMEYVYTFRLDNDGLYNYYRRQRTK